MRVSKLFRVNEAFPVKFPIAGKLDRAVFLEHDFAEINETLVHLGRNAGLLAGGAAPDTIGILQIVHRRDESSSGILMFLSDIGIGQDSPVQLFMKMP